MNRFVLFEKDSGICMYNHQWGPYWSTASSSELDNQPDSNSTPRKSSLQHSSACRITSIIQFFLQFAREIDRDGSGTIRVCFGPTSRKARMAATQTNYKPRFGTATMSRKKQTATASVSKTVFDADKMQMVCCFRDGLSAAGFYGHEAERSSIEAFLSEALDQFCAKYRTQIKQLQPLFESVVKNSEEDYDEMEVMQPFRSFDLIVESIRGVIGTPVPVNEPTKHST